MRAVSGYPESMLARAQSSSAAALLSVRELTVHYAAASEPSHPALLRVGFDIEPGEIVGILGESGSGKSTLALAILGLLPESTEVAGSILFGGNDLLRLNESGWRGIRGARIAMVFQEPGLSLSPVMRVGDQIAEVLRAHPQPEEKRHKQQVASILEDVGLVQVDRIYKAYPHQLSGGELHRVAIAQALACRPDVLIADEPTRSLDGARQAEILDLLRETNRKFGCALILITHNPGLLAGFADRVIVMYAGRIVEEGPVSQVFRRPLHPYTKGLLQLVPASLQNQSRSGRQHLPALPGALSDSDYLSPGCIFAARCPSRTDICQSEFPSDVVPEEGRRVSCFNYGN
jgi:oligopeptide/dipeptide ABC transporter ATP-binding protein